MSQIFLFKICVLICKYLPYIAGHIGILVDAAMDEGDAPEDNFHGGNDLAMTLAAAAHIAWSASMIEPKSELLL